MCLVGQVITDVTWSGARAPTKMRLGGVVHAARMAWALGVEYTVAGVLPAYLADQAGEYLRQIGCSGFHQLGRVSGSPNVFLIGHAQEAGPQRYESILRKDHRVEDIDLRALNAAATAATDLICFPDLSWFGAIANNLPSVPLHVDVDPTPEMIGQLMRHPQLTTVFMSTSASSLRAHYGGSVARMAEAVVGLDANAVIKENRGGSWLRDRLGKDHEAPAVGAVRSGGGGTGELTFNSFATPARSVSSRSSRSCRRATSSAA